MAVTTLLTIGPPHTLVQNQVYALPGRRCIIHTTAALQQSNDEAFATSSALASDGEISASFVRCTTANAVVSLKAA